MEYFNEDIQKILLAALLGAVIGLEREWSGKSAGFRTMILVSMGAALFTIVSYKMTGIGTADRIASNVVTGIGFLGAGLIFRNDTGSHGLTTATAVWAAAAIGMCAGVGYYWLAIFCTGLVWAVLVVFFRMQLHLNKMMDTRQYKILYRSTEQHALDYKDFFNVKTFRVLENKQLKTNGTIMYLWTIRANQAAHDKAVAALLKDECVIDLEY